MNFLKYWPSLALLSCLTSIPVLATPDLASRPEASIPIPKPNLETVTLLDTLTPSSETQQLIEKFDQPIPTLLQGLVTKEFPYKTVNLKDVLDLVEVKNLPIAIAHQKLNVQRARFVQVMALPLPGFYPFLGQSRKEGAIQVFGNRTFDITRDTVSPGYAFAWRVFPGGTQLWDIVAASKRLKAEKYNMQAVTQTEVAAAAEAYFDFLMTYLIRDANITSMQEAKALVELDEKLLAENKITLQELEQAKALYQECYHDLAVGGKVVLNMQILLHRLNLDTTVGLSPDFQDYRLLQVVPKSLTSDSVLAYAKENNLELKQLTELVSAQKWLVGSAVSAFVPYVDLGYTSAWIGSDYDNLQRFQNRAYTISTDLGYTMGVAPIALLTEQAIKVKQLKLEKLNAMRELETKILQNYVGAMSAEADYEFQKKAYEASEKAFKEGWQQLQNGEKVHLSVIASLNTLQQTRVGMAQATLNANNAQIQLLTDMGAATKENLLNGFALPLPKKSK